MISTKAILRKKPNKEGQFPICIRITRNRKTTYVYTGQYIDEKSWDETNHKVKKSHPNSNRLNNLILKKLSEVNDKSFELITEDTKTTLKTLKREIKQAADVKRNFFEIAKMHFQKLEDKQKIQQLKNAKARVRIFGEFLKSSDIDIAEIDALLLSKFQAYLSATRNVKERTIVNYLILIRTIYNIAIAEGLVEQKYYPFGKGKVQIKLPESQKIGLNAEEVQILENLKLESKSQEHALDVWLISFYFAGMRIGDTLKLRWSDFIDDRLHYRMNKNQELLALKVPEKAKLILKKYEGTKTGKDDFVFPELKNADLSSQEDIVRKTKNSTRNINRRLEAVGKIAGIEKPLSCHISRHSFANIAGDSVNIQILQKLYRHSSIKTTISYQSNFVHKDFDDAIDSVINF